MVAPNSLIEVEGAFREALAYHEAFRRLGIPADDIYVNFKKNENDVMIQIIAMQGERRFTCDAGLTTDPENLEERWKISVGLWNKGASEEHRQKVWKDSFVLKHGGSFISALVMRGFKIRRSAITFHTDLTENLAKA